MVADLIIWYFIPLLLSIFYFKVVYSRIGIFYGKEMDDLDLVLITVPYVNIFTSLFWIFKFPIK